MKIIVIIDEYLDEREFRNYTSTWLENLGFKDIVIEDERLSDENSLNDNDMMARKNHKRYTIQTFLNQEITEKEVAETIEDMKKENVEHGLIVTNKKVSDQFRRYAKEKGVEIIDRRDFTETL